MTPEKIIEMKLRIQEMEGERKVLKAKLQRLRSTLRKRGKSNRQVPSQPRRDQVIFTATHPQEQKSALLKRIRNYERQLAKLCSADRVQQAFELQTAIPLVYAEKRRLVQAIEEAERVETAMRTDLEWMQMQIAAIPANEKAIDGYQQEIDALTEKLFAYKKSEMRVLNAEELLLIHDHPTKYCAVTQKIEKEIASLRAFIEQGKHEIQDIQESEDRNMNYLNRIMSEQADSIRVALTGRDADNAHDIEEEDIEL
jgi:hypothetical protein